jgi:hypothetical protein
MEQMDRVVSLRIRLGQALDRAELGSLAFEALEDIFGDQDDLEEELTEQALGLYLVGNYRASAQVWTTFAELFDRQASIIDLMINRPPADSPGGEELAEIRQYFSEHGIFARAQALLMAAHSQRLSNNPDEAAASAEEARRLFESLAEDGGSSGDLAEDAPLLILLADGIRLGAVAATKQLGFQFENAAVTYLEGKKTLEKVRARMLQSQDSDTAALIDAITVDINMYKIASEDMLYIKAIAGNDFEEAEMRADATVKRRDVLMKSIEFQDYAGIFPFTASWVKVERCFAAANLAYVRAEIAANSQNWDEAKRQLTEVNHQYHQVVEMVVDLDIPQSRQIAESSQAIASQIIGSVRRRIAREQLLYAEIAKLKAENKQLENRIYQLAGKATFSGDFMSGDKFNIGKIGQAGAVGSGSTVSDFTLNQVNVENTMADVDMRKLAEQLEILIEKLKEAASDPEQYSALSEVSHAAQAARAQDKAGTLQHLKKAGAWVLNIASNVGVPLAVSALKGALELPS